MKISARRARPDTYTKLLIKAFGANGSTTFKDFSQSGHTITANGNAQMSTTQAYFPPVSAYFDGTGDYLSIPDSADWFLGTGDFTIEVRVRPATVTGTHDIISQRLAASIGSFLIYQDSGNYVFYASSNGTSWDVASAKSLGTATLNTWTHLGVARNGNNFYTFQDGTQVSTWTSSASLYDIALGLHVGSDNAGSSAFNGYMDGIRISKGIARWTANFTPPTRRY